MLAQDLATLDALSGGRLEIGLGAGWNKPEHDAIGIAKPRSSAWRRDWCRAAARPASTPGA